MFGFPLPASARYSYERRFGFDHQGTDIMVQKGTPVLAVEAGVAWGTTDPKGGNVVYLESINGRRYYYAHLDRWASILLGTNNPKVDVRVGDILGYVGNTGNASGGPAHLHFQIRDGSRLIDPFDELRALDPRADTSSRPTPPPKSGTNIGSTLLFAAALFWLFSQGGRR